MSAEPSSVPLSDDPLELASIARASAGSSQSSHNKGELPPPVTGGKGWHSGAPRSRAGDFWALVGCNAIVFGASVCIMVLELTASRLIANYVGQSLYTWTSVIGVVLAGISIGNYAGGYLADRFPPQKVLAWLFLLAGLLTISVLFMNGWAAGTRRPEGMHWQLWVMLVVAWVFFLPALSLGTISPVTASMALKRSAKTGITVGNIYAWGALGSIVGTFLAGFWLIGEFGSRQVVSMTATVLVVMGALVASGQNRLRTAALVGVLPLIALLWLLSSMTGPQMSKTARFIAGARSGWRTAVADFSADTDALAEAVQRNDDRGALAIRKRRDWRSARADAERSWAEWGERLGTQLHALGLTLALRHDNPDEYNDESDYYSINIGPGQGHEGREVKQLRLDFLIHSYYDALEPTSLHYDYEQVYAAVTERAASLWNKVTEVPLEPFPHQEELIAQLPSSVKYDPQAKRLSVRGAMHAGLFRVLLSIGPQAEFWNAVYSTWLKATSNEGEASPANGARILTPLSELPAGVRLPPGSLRYDNALKALVCSGEFDLDEVLLQGELKGYVEAVRELYRKSRNTSTLFIGGGGFVFPRWIEANFGDQPTIDVAEIDPAVKRAIETALELPREHGPPDEGKTWINTHIGDARNFVDDRLRENERLRAEGKAPRTYDFVYGDAFNDLSVPWHLTTAEFTTKVRDLLTPEQGVYLVNIIDIYPRAQYPRKADKVGAGEVDYGGDLPQSLAPEKIPADAYVPCRGEFRELQVQRQEGGYRLRYQGVMSKETLTALQSLDVTADTGRGRFSMAVRDLHRQTNGRTELPNPPPAALVSAEQQDGEWSPAHEPFRNLQLFRMRNAGYRLGLRGVMPDSMRNELLALSDAGEDFKRGVESLYRRSHQELVGRFLGRYVRTVRQVFPYVYVFNSDEDAPGESRDTFIVACSLLKLDFDDLASSGGHWRTGPFAWSEPGDAAGAIKDQGEMPAIVELARGIELTDDFAPVDNLLAPVFVNRGEDPD